MALSTQAFGLEPPPPTPPEVETVTQVAIAAQEIQNASRESLDFLAALALPDVYRYPFPPVYLSVWKWLRSYIHRSRDFSQLALGLPRGFAKTTLIKIFLLYVILFTERKFILVFSENQTKANNIIADVCDMLSARNIVAAFGDWRVGLEKDTQDLKKFGFRGRNISLMAGTVETARGINIKNERPDVQVFDDIQSRNCAESQIQSETLEREMIGTAMKSKSPHGCLFIFIANMYPTKWSILRHLKTNPNWVKFIAGGILESGGSLWEELQPIEQLMKEYQNDLSMGRPEVFYAEVLNDENAAANSLIDLTRAPQFPFQDDDIPGGNFIIIDPSGNKASSDATAIGYCEVHDSKCCMMEVTEEKLSPLATIEAAITIALTRNCRLIAIEGTAYQATLKYWFDFICQQRGIFGIECVELYSGQNSKVSRILAMIRSYAAGDFFIHPRCKPAIHMQISQFNPLRHDNTDGILDLLCYMPKVLELYGGYVTAMNIIADQEHSRSTALPFNSPF